MKRPKSKAARGLETRTLVYGDRRYPRARHQRIKVDVPRGEHLDEDEAAAMVALRTLTTLVNVQIVRIE